MVVTVHDLFHSATGIYNPTMPRCRSSGSDRIKEFGFKLYWIHITRVVAMYTLCIGSVIADVISNQRIHSNNSVAWPPHSLLYRDCML